MRQRCGTAMERLQPQPAPFGMGLRDAVQGSLFRGDRRRQHARVPGKSGHGMPRMKEGSGARRIPVGRRARVLLACRYRPVDSDGKARGKDIPGQASQGHGEAEVAFLSGQRMILPVVQSSSSYLPCRKDDESGTAGPTVAAASWRDAGASGLRWAYHPRWGFSNT